MYFDSVLLPRLAFLLGSDLSQQIALVSYCQNYSQSNLVGSIHTELHFLQSYNEEYLLILRIRYTLPEPNRFCIHVVFDQQTGVGIRRNLCDLHNNNKTVKIKYFPEGEEKFPFCVSIFSSLPLPLSFSLSPLPLSLPSFYPLYSLSITLWLWIINLALTHINFFQTSVLFDYIFFALIPLSSFHIYFLFKSYSVSVPHRFHRVK